MRATLLFLLTLAATSPGAEVYRQTGPDGKVEFSDRPGAGAKRVDVPPAQTISVPAIPKRPGTTTGQPEKDPAHMGEDTAAYSRFTVLSPTPEQAVRANNGDVTVRLALNPGLVAGHVIALKVDGEGATQTKTSRRTSITLNNLSRGLHTVKARVLDSKKNTLIRTDPVRFFVLRAAVRPRAR